MKPVGRRFRIPGMLRRRMGLGLTVGAAVALLSLLLQPTVPLRVLEARVHDLMARALSDAQGAHPDLLLVTVDDVSLALYQEEFGRWPWPREAHGYLVDVLSAGGARLIVYDIGFFEPHLEDPGSDAYFAEAIADAGRVILPVVFDRRNEDDAARLDSLLSRDEGRALLDRHALGVWEQGGVGGAGTTGGDDARRGPDQPVSGVHPRFGGALVPLPLFSRGAVGMGAMNLNPDPVDGVSRSERPVYVHRGSLYPSLALAAARHLEPERFGGTPELSDAALRLRGVTLDLHQGQLLLRWRGSFLDRGRNTYPVIPAYQLLNSYQQLLRGEDPDVPLERLEGKVVLVGLTGQGLFETRTTPLAPHDPGVILHATALDNLLSGDPLRRASPWIDRAGTVTAALLVAGGAAASSSALGGGLILLLMMGVTVLAGAGAYQIGIWTDVATPLLATGLAFAAAMAGKYVTEGRERRRIRDLFGRYVAPDYVKILEEDPEALRLGGERVPLTILFSDIRGFTALSERLPAEQVVVVLNEYLERMADIVFRNGGTLDKFMGDGLMAFWGAPVPQEDHARRAVQAGLEMLAAVEALNRADDGGAEHPLDIGIGIHTGEAVVGNMGSLTRKLDYTAVGDHVNLASRLESLNKERGTRMLVSRATCEAAGPWFQFEAAGEARVKGKSEPVELFQVAPLASPAPPPSRAAVAAPLLLALAVMLSPAGSLGAQQADGERSRWTDRVYLPGTWEGATLRPHATSRAETDTLALVAQVEGYAAPPRWRMEFRTVENGRDLSDASVLVGEQDEVWVLTALGSAPLGQHVLGEDPIVRFLVQTMSGGRPLFEAGSSRMVQREAERVTHLIHRQRLARADFSDDLLATGRAGRLGRQLLRLTAEEVGDQRESELVATAGARGVQVRTVDGEVEITPDPDAVREMEGRSMSPIELDRFLREGGLTGEGSR